MGQRSQHFREVGQQYQQFLVTKICPIHELHCDLIELTHLPSGAQVMYIANDDPENFFCLSFQTIPKTSNGVAHILEHTVLCGSKKFPVKDPFFGMQRRSLNTFMNALTGSDFTCYPAASQVPKDFYNLLDVYLDAVFYPNINYLSFLQEGHRLEFSIPEDPNSSLEYKGIVFNEMKGALSNPNSRLNEAIGKALFPDLTYGVNSGGDPAVIPTLTYEQLCDFHKEYYHPSRCLFFFYGNLKLEGHLDFIAKHVLDHASSLPPLSPIPKQRRFEVPRQTIEHYPIHPGQDLENKTLIAFAWLTCHILEQQTLLSLMILEIILLDTDASPLKMALLKSGLCKQVNAYLEDEISEIPMAIILKGCNQTEADNLEKLIFTTLKAIVEQGISLESVENAIHQLEFHRSEITGDSHPFGLSLFMRSALIKQHGGQAENGLKIHSLFDEIRQINLNNPHYFPSLIQRYLIDNPHFVRIIMEPDPSLEAKELAEERSMLQAIQTRLTEKEKQNLIERAAQLAEFQEKQEEADFDILPKVTLFDVPQGVRLYPLKIESIGQMDVYHHNTFTNEIGYLDLTYSLPPISEDDLTALRLMTSLMSQMGNDGKPYETILESIQANTGGIGASLSLNLQASDRHHFYPSLSIRGKALHRKLPHLCELMQKMALTVDFTHVSRLKELIFKQYTNLESSLNQNALKYAISLSAKGHSVSAKIADEWYGLEYYQTIKHIAHHFDSLVHPLIEKLQYLQSLIFKCSPDLVITSDSQMYDQMKRNQFYGLQECSFQHRSKWQPSYDISPSYSHGCIITSPIAFIAQVVDTVSYTHPDAPALNLVSHLCDNLTLHTKLREQGGAYGGGAVNNAMSGNFYFYSYRDPNIASSLEAFESSLHTIYNGDFEAADIESAILEMVQTLDTPVSPGNRADVAYGWLCEGKTTEMRQDFRNRILKTGKEEIIGAVERQLLPKLQTAATVVFASQNLLERENEKLINHGKLPLMMKSI